MDSRCEPCEQGSYSATKSFGRCTNHTNCSLSGMVLITPGDNFKDNKCSGKDPEPPQLNSQRFLGSHDF